jgi:endogenous inhibitor of DNA gyrase (YacG/DUF329 family)
LWGLIDVAEVLASAPRHAPWLFEVPIRIALRRSLCLTGRPWLEADQAALSTIEAARAVAGLPVPGPGWVHHVDAHQRDFNLSRICVECSAPIRQSSGRRLYCSRRCLLDVLARKAREQRLHAKADVERACAECGAAIDRAADLHIKYCSSTCRRRASRRNESARRRRAPGEVANPYAMCRRTAGGAHILLSGVTA